MGLINFFGAIRVIALFFYIFQHIFNAIIPLAMEVYIELALLENFCMDYVLLYCAKAVTKNRASIWQIALGALVGAVFAVVIPLFNLQGALAVFIKFLVGAFICFVSARADKLVGYLKFLVAFTAFTFVLGGGLIALFMLSGWDYSLGSGYFLASIPIGVPLFFGLILVIFAKKLAQKLTDKFGNNALMLKIVVGQSCAELKGFYDSGNKVKYMGMPVSVIPKSIAVGLINCERIKSEVWVHTVAGSKKMQIFTADKLVIDDGKEKRVVYNVKLGISEQVKLAVLHPDLSEDS